MHITLTQYLIVAFIVAVGALCQGTVGFGLNLIAAPIVGLVVPGLLPAAMVAVGTPLSIAIATREREHIDWTGVGWTTLGRLPGTALGAYVVYLVSPRVLGGLVGILVIIATIVAGRSTHHEIEPTNAIGAGSAAGFMDTVAATGGPPLALLYQHRPPAQVRATLATSFAIGTVISLTGLGLGHQIERWQILVAISMAPSLAIGLLLSRVLAARIAHLSLRPAILTFAATAGAAALLRAIIG